MKSRFLQFEQLESREMPFVIDVVNPLLAPVLSDGSILSAPPALVAIDPSTGSSFTADLSLSDFTLTSSPQFPTDPFAGMPPILLP